MKKYVLIVAMAVMLALPGITLAAAGSIGSGLNDDGGNITYDIAGDGDLQYDPDNDGSIVIDALITTDTAYVGIIYNVTIERFIGGVSQGAKSGDAHWKYDADVAKAHILGDVFIYLPPSYPYPEIDEYEGGVGKLPGNGMTIAAVGAQTNESYYTGNPSGYGPSAGAKIASHWIEPAVTLNAGDKYVLTLDTDAYGLGAGVLWLDDTNTSWSAGGPVLTIDIVPEPTSMLLLLGALPFLRRRR